MHKLMFIPSEHFYLISMKCKIISYRWYEKFNLFVGWLKAKTLPKNFWGVDLLRLVMLFASLSTNGSFSVDGWITGLLIGSGSGESSPNTAGSLSLVRARTRLRYVVSDMHYNGWTGTLCESSGYLVLMGCRWWSGDSAGSCGSAPCVPPGCSAACSCARSARTSGSCLPWETTLWDRRRNFQMEECVEL